MHLHHNSMDTRSSSSVDYAKPLRAISNRINLVVAASHRRTVCERWTAKSVTNTQRFSSTIRRLYSTAKWQSLNFLASQVVKRPALSFFSQWPAESFVVTQLARWPVPMFAEFLRSSIDNITRERGVVLGFAFLARSNTKVWMR
jgi:hypothetical protein